MEPKEILEEVKKSRKVYKVKLGRKCLLARCCKQRMYRIKVYRREERVCGIPEHAKITRELDEIVCLCCGRHYVENP